MLLNSTLTSLTLLLSLFAAGRGCSPPKQISSDPADSEELTRLTTSDVAEILMQDNTVSRGYQVAVRIDTTEWYSMDHVVRYAEATSHIRSISARTPNIGGGALLGLAVGVPASILIGGIAALSTARLLWDPTDAERRKQDEDIRSGFWTGFGITEFVLIVIGALGGTNWRTDYIP